MLNVFLDVMGYILIATGLVNSIMWVYRLFSNPEHDFTYGIKSVYAIFAIASFVSGVGVVNRDRFSFFVNPITAGDIVAGCFVTFLLCTLVVVVTVAMIYYPHKERVAFGKGNNNE